MNDVRLKFLLRGLIICCAFSSGQAFAKATPWKGGPFKPKVGGFYLNVVYKSPVKSIQITGELQFSITNLITKKTFTFAQDPRRNDDNVTRVWQVPSGKYALVKVTGKDSQGKQRSWPSPGEKPKRFLVKEKGISNLGTWIVYPKQASNMLIQFKGRENRLQQKILRPNHNAFGVINGFTGVTEVDFSEGGKDDAKDEGSKEARSSGKSSGRTKIAVFFRLDLLKNNAYAPIVASVINGLDAKVRSCYEDALEEKDYLKGDVDITFLISQVSKSLKKVKITETEIKHPGMNECILFVLKQAQFPINKNILGKLTYSFDLIK